MGVSTLVSISYFLIFFIFLLGHRERWEFGDLVVATLMFLFLLVCG